MEFHKKLWLKNLIPRFCINNDGKAWNISVIKKLYKIFSPDFFLKWLPFFAGMVIFISLFWFSLPDKMFKKPYSTALYDRNGYLLSARIAKDGQWRFPETDKIQDRFKIAIMEFEDRKFLGHCGIDPYAIIRAIFANIKSGKIVEGGSTLTMQTIRVSRSNRNRTIPEKMMEVWLAIRLEFSFTKDEIMAMYSAHSPFGGNVVGMEAACRRYFGRPPEKLTWAEASELAVLPNAPSLAHPGKNRDMLLLKRNRLLENLNSHGFISMEELNLALAEPLPPKPYDLFDFAPHLLDFTIKNGYTEKSPRIDTTIDAVLQQRALDIMQRHSKNLADMGISNSSCIIASIDTGEILSYIGNVSGDEKNKYVDCAAAKRSSGSILKPFLYAAMIDSGDISPISLITDIPTRIGSFSPENMSKKYSGAVPAAESLAKSLNIPFVRMLRTYGLGKFANLLRNLGFTTIVRKAEDYGLTLIMGGSEVKLVELANAYLIFAQISKAQNNQNTALHWIPGQKTKMVNSGLFSKASVWLTMEALLEAKRPNEEAAWQDYANSKKIAWKTGTSQGFRDAWAVGVSDKYLVAVWAGNATGEGKPSIIGASAAAPVLFDLFGLLPAGTWFPTPSEDLVYRTLCADSGYTAGDNCSKTVRQLLPLNSVEPKLCPYCKTIFLTSDGEYRVYYQDTDASNIKMEKRFILPPAIEWYYRNGRYDYQPLPPWLPGTSESSDNSFDIIIPENNSSFYIPVEIDGSKGNVVFIAIHRDPNAKLFWHLDGEYLGETSGDNHFELRPEMGEHELTVVDNYGRTISRSFDCVQEN